jgi:phytoene desaturase
MTPSSPKRVAVIGGGIGGLTAAGVLARAGHQVTLFEATDTLGGKAGTVEVDGLVFDTGPTVMTMPDTVRATFAALGAEDLMPTLTRLGVQTHYRWPDGRELWCSDVLEQTVASAEKLQAGEGAALARFYREAELIYRAAGQPYLEAPYETMLGFMARAARTNGVGALLRGVRLSTLDALARRHFASSHLQQFVNRFATYAGASPYEASAAFAMVAHIEQAFGVHHVRGGLGSLVVALAQAVRRCGVEVVLGRRAHHEKRGSTLVAGPAGEEQPFDAVVVNADPLALQGREREPLTMSGYVAMFEARTRLQLPHHSILFSKDVFAEFEALGKGLVSDDLTVHLCHPAATDESMAPLGTSGVYAMVNVPALGLLDAQRWATLSGELEALIRRKMTSMVPALRAVSLRKVAERTPVDLARKGAPGGSIYGFLPHGRFGPFRRPAMRGAERGVFFAGGGTHPGGGVPLVMLSGRFAAGMTDAHLRGVS